MRTILHKLVKILAGSYLVWLPGITYLFKRAQLGNVLSWVIAASSIYRFLLYPYSLLIACKYPYLFSNSLKFIGPF